MDYEKKYKEANDKVAARFGTNVAKEIFTDLYESEDEKIRKELIDFFQDWHKIKPSRLSVNVSDILAWLEKQGEQKPTLRERYKNIAESEWFKKTYEGMSISDDEEVSNVNKAEPKFKVGDSIKTTNEEPLTITKIDDKGYWSEDLLICGFDDAAKWELVEQKPWSEEDEKILKDILVDVKFEGYNNDMLANSYKKINWLKSLKNRVLPQPKHEWSEKDKRILDALITALNNERFAGRLKFLKGIKVSLVIDWLKSLKEKIKKEAV